MILTADTRSFDLDEDLARLELVGLGDLVVLLVGDGTVALFEDDSGSSLGDLFVRHEVSSVSFSGSMKRGRRK